MSDTAATATSTTPRTVRDLVLVLATAAASWGAVKMELRTMVRGETDEARIALSRDAAGRIAHLIDSSNNALGIRIEQRLDSIEEHFDARLATLPMPRTISETIMVPGPPDSVQVASLKEHIDKLNNAVRMLAVERGRERNEHETWRELLRRNGILKRGDTEKRSGDGH